MFHRFAPLVETVAVAVVVALGGTAVRAADPLTLTVTPSQPSYALGEQIELLLSLSLDPLEPLPVLVTRFSPGAIRVKRLTKDGVVIKPAKKSIDFEEDPLLMHLEELYSLLPGSSVPLPFDVQLNGPTGALLVTARLGRVKHQARVYALDGPGSYTVQLIYQFKHPRDPTLPPVPSGVVRRAIRSNVASFVVN
jgi:hypothetical protein